MNEVATININAIAMIADRLDGKVPQPVGGSDELGPRRLHITWGNPTPEPESALAAAAINQEVIDGETKDRVQDTPQNLAYAEVAPLRQPTN